MCFPADLHGSVTVIDVRGYILTLSLEERRLVSEVVTLLQLILVMPATNASSERSFSVLRRVKNYLCSTMTQDTLNHAMLLHCHKELTELSDSR